jgi:transcriptional regulator with XRE-family HTH domain
MGKGSLPMSETVLCGARPRNKAYPAQCQTIGERIRTVRLDRKLTQLQVAGILGVDVDTVTGWELGRTRPQVHYMPGISVFLGDALELSKDSSLGERLVHYRTSRGWTQKTLAATLLIDPTTLSRIERGIQKRMNQATKLKLRGMSGEL